MITDLRAQNFKSWKDTGDLRIAPLTGLFGANSSGKTGILQALLVLKQSVESADPRRVLYLGDERSDVNLGTFKDVVHGHDSELAILGFTLCWRGHDASGRLAARFGTSQGQLRLSEFVCTQGTDALSVVQDDSGFHFELNGGPSVPTGSLWGYHTSPPSDPTFGLRVCLESVNYIGPLRQRPTRKPHVWSGNTPSKVGSDGAEFAQALLSPQGRRRTLRDVAASLQRMRLANVFEIEPFAPGSEHVEFRLKTNRASTPVLLPDVGFGVSQVLPILVLCYYADEGSTLVIEQPELHLHPAAQSELADVLIDVVKNRNMQIILESHSEHLLRRLQRRIAEGQFEAGDAALYFCEMDNGASKCTPLELTSEGFIKNWPKDFFGDEMGDIAAISEEAMKRRLQRVK